MELSNRLIHETSPYLLQHAHNPVDWYPWCEEAFQRAREEGKPIFLSIGYSTCHWCHVMAHESFEDQEIAALLNQHFISIKVDKEERPDIDSIYMAVCQAFTGSGGWPTSVFMTAEQKPFFAGTYFPKSARGGMLGFRELLQIIREKWETDRDTLARQADRIVKALQEQRSTGGRAEASLLDDAAALYGRIYDREFGGFGGAPKFPAPHNLLYLLGYHERYQSAACLEMAERTLQQMYRGGLFDHIGYGFCRYSTDRQFLVPHFEKMLYDNALLILAYCKAYTVTNRRLYLEVAEKTADYILRRMTAPEGGFYSAEDADSDGEEGKYYLFTPEEVAAVLGEEDGAAFSRHFGITKAGNFEGKSIPNLLRSDMSDGTFDAFLPQLRAYRERRCRLHLDDKVLTSWNALMIAALCRLYRVSKDPGYLSAAKAADGFLQEHLCVGDLLFVSYRAGKRGEPGFLDDYAAYIFAQLALYEVTLDEAYLKKAERLCGHALSAFGDEKDGGFFLYGKENERLILRPKETYDGAIPSGNSLIAWDLVRLAQLTEGTHYEKEAERQLHFLAAGAAHYPPGYAMFLLALLEHSEPPVKVTAVLADPADREGLPLTVPAGSAVTVLAGPTKEMPLKNGRTTFYVCRGHTCLPPVNEMQEIV